MKVLFLHLSDMHFVSDSSYTKKDCEEIANAVVALQKNKKQIENRTEK